MKPLRGLYFFACRDVGRVALAHPCASRHLDILSIVAGGMEKVRPGTGREAGLGHAGSDLLKLPQGLAFDYAGSDLLTLPPSLFFDDAGSDLLTLPPSLVFLLCR